jgi:hypothetical protein
MKLERGGGGEGEWYGHPGRQCPRGGKINILNKNIDFFCPQEILKYRNK